LALAGITLSDLISAMRAGNTYTNVHTNDGVAPTNMAIFPAAKFGSNSLKNFASQNLRNVYRN
jgi:hypothetical protein